MEKVEEAKEEEEKEEEAVVETDNHRCNSCKSLDKGR